MEDFEEVVCPICKSGDYEIITHDSMFGIYVNFALCKNCGFGYLNPRWTSKRYMQYYTEEYDTHYRIPELSGKAGFWAKYNGIVEIMERLKALNIAPAPSSVSNILDVGSGMGWYLEYLKKNFYPDANLWAIEPSKGCQDNFPALGINLLTDDVDKDWHLEYKGKFDLIIMRHVLEHFLDPVTVLKKVSHVLSDKGILYVGLPSMDNPNHPVTNDFIRVAHVNYFTKTSLENAFNLAGLTAMHSINYSPTNYHELYSIARKSEKVIQPHISKEEYNKSKAIILKMMAEEKAPLFSVKQGIRRRIRKYKKLFRHYFHK